MSTEVQSAFPPIADYAFLSDCETCALIASNGQVEWLCLPRPDSPSVFGGLLDRTAGVFGLAPEGVKVPTQRRYLPGSMVLETTWRTATGWLVVHDSLGVGAWDGKRRPAERRRPPARADRGARVRADDAARRGGRPEALHRLEGALLGRARPRRAARRGARRPRPCGALAQGRRRDRGRGLRARRGRPRCVHAALRRGRARRCSR
jgi:hypothetical protein